MCKLPNERDWLWGKLGLALVGGAMLIKSLIQFSVDRQGSVPSLLFDLRPNYGGGNEDNGAQPCSRLALTHASTGDSWTLMGESGSVSCGVTAPFSWVLVHTRFCV